MEMAALDSPLEALAFNYLSFGLLTAIHNVWTWVAVITAAVSFWRIRAVGGGGGGAVAPDARHRNPDAFSPPMVSPPPHTEEQAEAETEPAALTSASSTAATIAQSVADVETITGVTKGKFTVYYQDECEGELAAAGEVDDGGVGEFGVVGSGGGDYWCEGWEKILRMRLGDETGMGWYRHQDLTALDGNVVRLWDGCRGKSTISLLGSVNI